MQDNRENWLNLRYYMTRKHSSLTEVLIPAPLPSWLSHPKAPSKQRGFRRETCIQASVRENKMYKFEYTFTSTALEEDRTASNIKSSFSVKFLTCKIRQGINSSSALKYKQEICSWSWAWFKLHIFYIKAYRICIRKIQWRNEKKYRTKNLQSHPFTCNNGT